MHEHPIAYWGSLGAVAGFGIGVYAIATYDCPAGHSCSTEAIAIPDFTLLGWGVGSLVGLTIKLLQ
jgi:hypothetical protein